MDKTYGRCLCGQIQFEIDGEPKFQGNCHCTHCKQATGASYATIAFFPAGSVKITAGEPKTYHHTSDRGSKMTKKFCTNCGSLMLGSNSIRENMTAVFVGSLTDPKWIDPQFNVWTDRKLKGTFIDPNLANFEKNRTA